MALATSTIFQIDRVRAVHQSGLLDRETTDRTRFNALVRQAAAAVAAPRALLTLVDDRRQAVLGATGFSVEHDELDGIALAYSLASRVLIARGPMQVTDARVDPLLRFDPLIANLGNVAYLGVPLLTDGGHIVGVLAVLDTRPRSWSDAEADALIEVATALRAPTFQPTPVEVAAPVATALPHALDGISDICFIMDRDWCFTYVNVRAAALFGRAPLELTGQWLWGSFPEMSGSLLGQQLRRALEQATPIEFDWHTGIATWYEVRAFPSRAGGGLTVLMRDVTQQKRTIAQLTQRAHYDGITGLANRSLLLDRMAQTLAHARRHGLGTGVLFIDLDDFKQVNDRYGHHIGDTLLFRIGRRIRDMLRAEDTAARLGGDEFAVLLTDVADEPAAVDVAQRLLTALHRPVAIDNLSVTVTASIGVTFGQASDLSAEDLLRDADTAMYRAKTRGKRPGWGRGIGGQLPPPHPRHPSPITAYTPSTVPTWHSLCVRTPVMDVRTS